MFGPPQSAGGQSEKQRVQRATFLRPSTAAAGIGIAAWHDGGKADPYLSVKGVRGIASD
jgi:hypothetical protein